MKKETIIKLSKSFAESSYQEDGVEYWLARDLQVLLDYDEWRNFSKVIDKAKTACEKSGQGVGDHFVDVNKTIPMPKGASKQVDDIMLTRYACYLIAQNGDLRKPKIADAQKYFAIHERRHEVMTDIFTYDVFLSHSSKDNDVVRPIAERLKADGVRVWFDEWEIKPGDSIPAKIEEGLENSRILVLCMSANAFGSDWAQLESGTFRFRDPLNKERRFIPLRLDDAPINGSLAQFIYINWSMDDREQEYAKLLETFLLTERTLKRSVTTAVQQIAEKSIQLELSTESFVTTYCLSKDGQSVFTGNNDCKIKMWDIESGCCLREFEGHRGGVYGVVLSVDQQHVFSCGEDMTVRMWDVETRQCLRVFEGHSNRVYCVILSVDQRFVFSGSDDKTIRMWDVETGRLLRAFEGHKGGVNCVALSRDQQKILSGSDDKTVRVWEIESGRCLQEFAGHSKLVWTVAWSNDYNFALSGSFDNTVRLWEMETGRCLYVFEGHTDQVRCVVWSSNKRFFLSCSDDETVRIWDVETGRCLRIFEGHDDYIMNMYLSADQLHVLSCDENGCIRMWNLSEFVAEDRTSKATNQSQADNIDQIQYTNAKVLLVGDTSAGKTCLAHRLAAGKWRPSDGSTVGAWSTQWLLSNVTPPNELVREIWLWDFGGQADQRLVHQLYMEHTAMVLLLFDADKDDVLTGLREWLMILRRSLPTNTPVLLVAGRVDAGFRASRTKLQSFAKEQGVGYFETSAMDGTGCNELIKAIIEGIPWNLMEQRTAPRIFKQIKDQILKLRDEGRVLLTFKELRDLLWQRMGNGPRFSDEILKSVIGLLDGPGTVKELEYGTYILLQPEWINAYAQAIIRTLRQDPYELGCLPLRAISEGKLLFQAVERDGNITEIKRLPNTEECVVLREIERQMEQRGLCVRQLDKLVFPSYCGIEYPSSAAHTVFVSYMVKGYLDDIYATLVVKLADSDSFKLKELWRDAADFATLVADHLMGIKLERKSNGNGEIYVYFSQGVTLEEKAIFANYIYAHLVGCCEEVQRLRHYVCPHCHTPKGNSQVLMKRLHIQKQRADTECDMCGKRFDLWDALEKTLASSRVREKVEGLKAENTIRLDSRRKDKLLALEVMARISSADQKCFEITATENIGLDVELEFTDAGGNGTGKRLYLLLKSGNSHLRTQKNGTEIFDIKEQRLVEYWLKQPHPVMLVIGTFAEDDEWFASKEKLEFAEVRWMEISSYLKLESQNGPVKWIEFKGERLDVMSVRRWRTKVLDDPLLYFSRDSLLNVIDVYPDERTRCMAVRRLAAWPERDIRDRLQLLATSEVSSEFRASCFEALCDGWWREQEIRSWIRTRFADEPEELIRERLLIAIKNSRKFLSGFWESRLSEQSYENNEPEAISGYPAFRVVRFRLCNIGPFRDTGEVELQPDINVFLGDNAAGKTTLLRCLALASIGLAAANEVVDNPEAFLRKGAQHGSIEVLFELIPDPDSLPEESGYFGVGLEIETASSRFTPLKVLTLQLPATSELRFTNSAESLSEIRSKAGSQLGFVTSYGAIRAFNDSRYAIQPELKKSENEWVLSLFNPEARLVNPEVFSKLIRGDTSNIEDSPQEGLSVELIEALQASLKHLFPEVTAFLTDGDNDLQLNGTTLRFGELSDGYRSLFALMGHLLRSSLKIRNWKDDPTQIHGISMIDEMDLHLHPAWQIHVIQDFQNAFPNLQLIASTHSPLVVAALKRENILIMQREDDDTMKINHPDYDPQGLGVGGILTNIFNLSSTIDQPTLNKISRRLSLYSKREQWSEDDELEYMELSEQLAALGFNREFTDPYFEMFATAMVKRHKASMIKLTLTERQELDEYADRLLANLMENTGE